MSQKRKAALFKMGSFSHTNASVLDLLRAAFPNYDIDIIEISSLFSRKDPLLYLHCARAYYLDVLRGKKKISETLLRTPYAFHKVKRTMLNQLRDRNYSFTFQTQSIFDLSVPGTPHFTYTDHTHLENLRYPGFQRERLMSELWIKCEKQIYNNATLNFTMSSNITRSIIEDYGCNQERVVCVYCGANVQAKESDLFDDQRYYKKDILFVGLDWHRKGGPILVEAFKIILGTFPDATLTIVGCKPDLNLANCNVVGRIALPDVKGYFERASLFCLPTTLEPFGIVFLEAMAHQLPIVASDIGAIPDFVLNGKNGYRVEPNNPSQLAAKIIEIIGSPEMCKKFGEHGRMLLWEKYTWGKTGKRIREKIEPFLN